GPRSPAQTATPPNASAGRSEAGFVERLPVDRITQCLDVSRWEIIEWVGRKERRVTPPLTLPGCAPRTEAGKAYARAGSELLGAIINAARLTE
ncbi:MAG TPA: hypothetical protein VFS96_07425, partial [Nitrolancea sp.]|nr:hypothetical protein [Nitrolancea sp.]